MLWLTRADNFQLLLCLLLWENPRSLCRAASTSRLLDTTRPWPMLSCLILDLLHSLTFIIHNLQVRQLVLSIPNDHLRLHGQNPFAQMVRVLGQHILLHVTVLIRDSIILWREEHDINCSVRVVFVFQ